MLGISRSGVCSVHVRSMYSVLAMKYIHFSFKIYSWVLCNCLCLYCSSSWSLSMINMCIASSYTCFFGNSCVSCQIYSNYVIPGVLHTQLSLLVIMVILLADPLLSTKLTPHKPAAGTIINMSLFVSTHACQRSLSAAKPTKWLVSPHFSVVLVEVGVVRGGGASPSYNSSLTRPFQWPG